MCVRSLYIYLYFCVCHSILHNLEIPLFHIMTAKVTFGNINGVDSAATYVTLHDTPNDQTTAMYSTASSTSAAEGLKQRRAGGSLSSQPPEPSVDSTGMDIFKS